MFWLIAIAGTLVGLVVVLWLLKTIIGVQYIPNTSVGIVERLWGKPIAEGRIIATDGEAGYQSDILRGGLHFGLPGWKFRLHKVELVSIPQGQIGYVYARDGQSLANGQTLSRVVACNNFQDSRLFLIGDGTTTGQRGRQRAILREGVYAINLSLFTVIAKNQVYTLNSDKAEIAMVSSWQKQLNDVGGFSPIYIGSEDQIGIVSVQDGQALPPGEIIAPDVQGHNNFQDPEAFLKSGGYRGRQYQPLVDGTYFINRWFALVEYVPKTTISMGYVGVVISYYGKKGKDLSGSEFRHGERVTQGERGVWSDPLGPGKYAFNPYAGAIILVPTTNFVLHWITGKTEATHKYDENLRSIDLVTMDAYEPVLPLSLVVHLDYQKAPGVVQRFGDVKKLINQTIDPMLSAFFRDVCHKRSMLELLQLRDVIQKEAKISLAARFAEFDIEVVDVLIGKPEAGPEDGGKIETLLEQLRQRQLSREQVETFGQQQIAAEKRKNLEEANAIANKQKELTNSSVQINIVENEANAQLARSQMEAKQTIVMADAQLEQSKRVAQTQIIKAEADAKQTVLAATAESERQILIGKGEGTKVLQIGIAEATALRQKVASYGDPRLYALVMATESISQSDQPLVPERVFITGGTGVDGKSPVGNVLQMMMEMLMANNTSFKSDSVEDNAAMKDLSTRMVNQAVGVLTAGDTPTTAVTSSN